MTVHIGTSLLTGFLLAMVRAVAWLVVAPPFSTRAIPGRVRALLAMALALPVAPKVAGSAPDPTVWGLTSAVVGQVLVGVALGFLTALVFAAAQAAGDLIDVFGGFQLATAFDPLSLTQNSVFGRLYQLLAVTLLFAVDGHLLIIRGFLVSYDALPLDSQLSLTTLQRLLVHGLVALLVSALQIGGPLIAVLFLADVALGLLTRVAPALNAFALGFPAKIGLTLLIVGTALPILPGAVSGLVDQAVRAALTAVGR